MRLGVHYLEQLTRRFDGHIAAAVASYNAGPHVVQEWIEESHDPESDVWIESIPYTQTRNYVKRVLRSLVIYRLLENEAGESEQAAAANSPQRASPAADTGGDDISNSR